jgi:hypothetical protein
VSMRIRIHHLRSLRIRSANPDPDSVKDPGFLWVIFALPDPDPADLQINADQCRSGSETLIFTLILLVELDRLPKF